MLTQEEWSNKKLVGQRLAQYYGVTRLSISGWRRDQYFVRLQGERFPLLVSALTVDDVIASGRIDRNQYRPAPNTALPAAAHAAPAATTAMPGPSNTAGPSGTLPPPPRH